MSTRIGNGRPSTAVEMSSYSRKASSCTTYRDLQTTEARGQFSCLLCLEPSFSSAPRQLDCQHAFCGRCLAAYRRLYCVQSTHGGRGKSDRDDDIMACPTCRRVSRLKPEGGSAPTSMSSPCVGAATTPASGYSVGSGCTGTGSDLSRPVRKISLGTELSQRCDACLCRRRMEIADFYCGKCSLNLCNECKAAHDAQPLYTSHSVIHISNKDTVSLGCDVHGGRQACIYFCFDCDVPACSVCLLHEHAATPSGRGSTSTAGHRTAKMGDALAARRDALKTLLNDLGPKLDRLEVKAKRLTAAQTSPKTNGVETGNVVAWKPLRTGQNSDTTSSLPLLHRRHKQDLSVPVTDDEADGDHDDDESEEDDDIDAKDSTDHVVRFFIINNNISRSMSHSSTNSSDDSTSNCDVESIESRTELLVDQIGRLRRLFETSTRLLELSQSRRLLTVYTEVAARLQTAVEIELPQLLIAVTDLLSALPTSAASRSSTDPGSCSSFSSSGGNVRTRHSSGLSRTSGGADADDDDEEGQNGCLSLLVRPKLVWKSEKLRNTEPLSELWNPCSVVFLPHDDGVIAAEYDMATAKNNKLCIFDSTGKRQQLLAQGQIQPLGVAMTRDDHIAVTDCQGKRVKIMNLAGQTVSDLGKGQFGWPYGIVANSRGQLIVTDAFSDSISIYSPSDGKRIRQFGSSGIRDFCFRNPYHVTVDARDNILVADSGNNCVKAFDPTGSHFLFRCDVTTHGPAALSTTSPTSDRTTSSSRRHHQQQQLRGGRLRDPRGVTVDLRGNILVADNCRRICMFDSAGHYVRNLLTDEDWVKYPEAVHCSRSGSGLMAVTEWNPNSLNAVKVFSLYE